MDKVDKITFDFNKYEDLVKALQLSVEHAANNTLPISNVFGIQRGVSGRLRLHEDKVRYEVFVKKYENKGSFPAMPLMDW